MFFYIVVKGASNPHFLYQVIKPHFSGVPLFWKSKMPPTFYKRISGKQKNWMNLRNIKLLLETFIYVAITVTVICRIKIETVMWIMQSRKCLLYNFNRDSHLHNCNENCHPHICCSNCYLHSCCWKFYLHNYIRNCHLHNNNWTSELAELKQTLSPA